MSLLLCPSFAKMGSDRNCIVIYIYMGRNIRTVRVIAATRVAIRMYIWYYMVVVVTRVTLHSNEVFAPRCEAPRQDL